MAEKPFAFHDLPASAYPFRVEALNEAGRVVWSVEVTAPGVVEIPALAKFFGPISTRVTFADDQTWTEGPPRRT